MKGTCTSFSKLLGAIQVIRQIGGVARDRYCSIPRKLCTSVRQGWGGGGGAGGGALMEVPYGSDFLRIRFNFTCGDHMTHEGNPIRGEPKLVLVKPDSIKLNEIEHLYSAYPQNVLYALYRGSPAGHSNHCAFLNSLWSIKEELSLQTARHSSVLPMIEYSFYT